MAAGEYLGFLAKAIFAILVVVVIIILAQQVSSGVMEKGGGLANWFQQCILCSIWNILAEFFGGQWNPAARFGWHFHPALLEGWIKCAGFAPDKPLIYVKDLNLTVDDEASKNKLAEEVADCIIKCVEKARCPDVVCCVFSGVNFQTSYEDFECRVTYYLSQRNFCNVKAGVFDDKNFSNNACTGDSSCMGGFSCSSCGNDDKLKFEGKFEGGIDSSEKGSYCIYIFLNRWGETPGQILPPLVKEIKVVDENELWQLSCGQYAKKMGIYC